MRLRNAKLAAKLVEFGWRCNDLAISCRIHRNTVSAILNLRSVPKPETAKAIAGALKCKVADLFGEVPRE